jgi:hypothetical protein
LAEDEGFVSHLSNLMQDAFFPFFITISDLRLSFQVGWVTTFLIMICSAE